MSGSEEGSAGREASGSVILLPAGGVGVPLLSVFSVYSGGVRRKEDGGSHLLHGRLSVARGVREEVLDTAQQQNCDKRWKINSLIEFVESESLFYFKTWKQEPK